MADVVHKTTLEYKKSVSTGRYNPDEWFINPVIPNVPQRHWVNDNGDLRAMTEAEAAAHDTAENEKKKQAAIDDAKQAIDSDRMDVPDAVIAREKYLLELINDLRAGQNKVAISEDDVRLNAKAKIDEMYITRVRR